MRRAPAYVNAYNQRRALAFQYARAKRARAVAIARGNWPAAYAYARDMIDARQLRAAIVKG